MNVADILKLALPPGTKLAAGENGMAQTVTWATTFRSRPPALDHLEGGELVLLSLAAVRVVDASLTLARIVTTLQERHVAAVAVDGLIDEAASRAADAAGLALLALPAGADLHGLERSVIGLLVNKQAELQARTSQLQRQLSQVAMQGKGLSGIAAEFARQTGKSVAVFDARLQVLAEAGPEAPLPLSQGKSLQLLVRNPVPVGQEPGAEWIEAQAQASPRWAAVIPVNNRGAGLVTLAAPAADLTELDGLLVARAASVCAMEMVKERAVVEAEAKLQGDFVRDVLRGTYASEAAILTRAAHLEWEVEGRHGVAALEMPTDGAAVALRSAMSRRGVRPLVAAWDQSGVFIYPLPEETSTDEWRKVVEQIRSEIANQLNLRSLSAGVGRPHTGLKGMQRSYVEAEQALRAGQRLYGAGQTVAFADLGAYRLLAHLQGTAELQSFEQETLGDLIGYDDRTSSQLLPTLE
ncbi:MAG TPA: PucR family transcriptional regulator ligand-binding domain-containing protein, partial [Chloroflexota bacterium]|nr:PucR family transcriptional regulator ligand-binding domain-containing protein [Chloroflexota bacterium]